MSRNILIVGLLFFLTSCELIIINKVYEEGEYIFTADYWEERLDSWIGFYDEEQYDDEYYEEYELDEEVDNSAIEGNTTSSNNLNPNFQEISFPEQLIDNYVSSSCNDYKVFNKDAIYFELNEDENSSFIIITRLDDSRYFGIVDKVFKDILTGDTIIETPVYDLESESTDPVVESKLIIKDSFGELTITQTYPIETIDENEKNQLIEEGLIDENDKELSLIRIEKGAICIRPPKKPESKPKQSKPRVLDSDNDGIQDSIDNCPNKYGSISGGGCPDKDGDGIIDSKDRCPANSGSEKFSGCPDSDGDGIPDYDDDCSYEPGSINNKGCPEPEAPAQTEVPFAIVDQVPSFPSCQNRFNSNEKLKECFNKQIQKHISRNFRYPEIAQEMGIQGRVFVTFIIDQYGEVKNIRTRGPDQNLQNEAYRIIQKLPKMQPGIHKGIAVSVPYSIPITFKLR
jgi:TonB family protein